jgi:eukaryotic-like serine/threonine-protein kinase
MSAPAGEHERREQDLAGNGESPPAAGGAPRAPSDRDAPFLGAALPFPDGLAVDRTVGADALHDLTTQQTDDLERAKSALQARRRSLVELGHSFGDYELIKRIATGGMGVVYLAQQKSLRRLVALKMILAQDLASIEDLSRFRTEAEAAAQLDHKGIVPIFEVGEHDGRPFFSMAYIEGGSLADWIKQGPVPCRKAAATVLEVTEAIAYAHARGVIHRDLKPSNVLLDKDGRTRVADFGLAKVASGLSHLTITGQVLGTPTYMAPEQAAGKNHEIGPAADLYSLGAVLYCLVTARPPFQAASPVETLRLVAEQEPVSLRQLNGSVSRDLDTICRKCLQKEPAKRYDNAISLAEDLRRFLAGEPIKARPVGSFERFWRWCRRNPKVAALSAGILVSLVVGTVVAWHFAIQARREAKAAVASELLAKEAQELSERRRYAAEIHLAEQDWRDSQIPRVEQRLRSLGPQRPTDSDVRSFEWYFLDRLCHLEQRTLRGPEQSVRCVAFSRDDRELAVAIGDSALNSPGTIQIWNPASGEYVRTLTGHSASVQCVAYSPDGTRLASAGAISIQPGEVILWDAATGRIVHNLRTHDNPVWSLAFSPDGKFLAGASGGYRENGAPLWGEVLVWDLTAGKLVRRLRGHDNVACCVAFSGDGRWLASGDTHGVTKIWNVADWTTKQTQKNHHGQVMSLAFSPDSRRFASGGLDQRVRIWNTASLCGPDPATQDTPLAIPFPSSVYSVAFSPDGARVAAGCADRSIRIWEIATEREVLTLRGHERSVVSVAFSHDGWRVASASEDRTVKIWDATTDRRELPLYDHERADGRAPIVVFSGDGRRFASAGSDRSIRIWDTETALILHTLRGHASDVADLAFSRDGRWLISAAGEQSVRVWDVEKGELGRTFEELPYPVRSVAIAPDGRSLACCGGGRRGFGGGVLLVNFPAGDHVAALLSQPEASDRKGYATVAFSPDGQWLAAGHDDGEIRVWNTRFESGARTLRAGTDAVRSLAFGPDSCSLASAGANGSIRLWDVATGALVATMLGHTADVVSVTFTPGGRRLVSSGADSTVKFWDIHAAQEVFSVSTPWPAGRVACHPDRRRIVVGSKGSHGPEYSMLLWDARPMTAELRASDEARSRVAFWYGRLAGSSEVRNRLSDDHALVGPAHDEALALVDPVERNVRWRRAEDLLCELVSQGMLHDEILARVRTMPGVDESVRREALSLGTSLVELEGPLDRTSRAVVNQAGGEAPSYRRALVQAETACRRCPGNSIYRTTLGMAQYRTGNYREAVATLARALELGVFDRAAPNPAALAFTSMAQYQLHRLDEARDTLKALRKLVNEPPGSTEQAKTFLREAEMLIERKPAGS